ncbi:hypothetical protein JCM8547_003004 [Rhodosporidiobolus lusitaniae]
MPLPPSLYYAAPVTPSDPSDDWETAYDRNQEQSTEQQKNARLWQDANTAKPTYSILSSSSSTSRPPPSAAVNEATTNGPPQLKILKRPSNAPSPPPSASQSRSSSALGTGRGEKTFAEREKEYEAARRRIYGEDVAPPAGKGGGKAMDGVQGGLSKLSLTGGGSSRSSSVDCGCRAETRTASPASTRNSRTRSPRPPPSASSAPQPLPQGVSVVRAPKGPSAASGGFGFGDEGGKRREQTTGRGR